MLLRELRFECIFCSFCSYSWIFFSSIYLLSWIDLSFSFIVLRPLVLSYKTLLREDGVCWIFETSNDWRTFGECLVPTN